MDGRGSTGREGCAHESASGQTGDGVWRARQTKRTPSYRERTDGTYRAWTPRANSDGEQRCAACACARQHYSGWIAGKFENGTRAVFGACALVAGRCGAGSRLDRIAAGIEDAERGGKCPGSVSSSGETAGPADGCNPQGGK